ncbi:MAG TPA: polymer-forming cytoskeletal protein [Caldithrix abyssi]|uniref:Polymer-forming cytoskeletal protein n=1 Tax=Caldithrix abyssi TaxID=187145 RepID=A0A7V1PWD1_CALAY|nr:polymer-forming cytoskeletal protein [Caldithrix abyssi]
MLKMGLKNNSSTQSTELNFIGKGTHIEGNVTTSSSIRIDGSIKGTLNCKNTVTIGESGKVEGDIQAQNAIIGGQVQGRVVVLEKLVLENKSSLVGELQAKKLIIDEGAVFDGTSAMGAQKPLSTSTASADVSKK